MLCATIGSTAAPLGLGKVEVTLPLKAVVSATLAPQRQGNKVPLLIQARLGLMDKVSRVARVANVLCTRVGLAVIVDIERSLVILQVLSRP